MVGFIFQRILWLNWINSDSQSVIQMVGLCNRLMHAVQTILGLYVSQLQENSTCVKTLLNIPMLVNTCNLKAGGPSFLVIDHKF